MVGAAHNFSANDNSGRQGIGVSDCLVISNRVDLTVRRNNFWLFHEVQFNIQTFGNKELCGIRDTRSPCC